MWIDLGLNYCNKQVRDAENLEDGSTTVGFGIILIVIGLIITGISGGIWIIVRSRAERTEEIYHEE